jgi:maleate isomerase
MKLIRRQFMKVAAVAATTTPTFVANELPSTKLSRWEPDGAGFLARIGVLTPDDDPVPESEIRTMAPQGVSIHASRVHWNHEARAFAEPPYVDGAAELVARVKPRVILYAFTSSSYVLGAEADDTLRVRLEKVAAGIPVVLTCVAGLEALHVLGAHRVALIHPPWFTDDVSEKGKNYFTAQGFDVVYCGRMTPAGAFAEVPPAEVYGWVQANAPRQADAVFIGGNGLRAIGVIHALEEILSKPVLTANQVLLWQALRRLSISSQLTKYGRVFTKT